MDRPISFSDKRLVDGVTTELKKMTDELTAYLFVVGSVNLLESDSNRLQFILWNSENYNMSRTNWIQQQVPSVAAVKSRGFTALLNRSATGLRSSWTGVKKRMPRDIINPFTITYIPQQWNNSYSSFVNQINTKTWKVQGEAIAIRNLSIVQVPALIIEWVKLDVKGQVREGYPFTVACNANGSGRKDLTMGWFKDGHRVDDSFALARNVSIFIHEKQDLRGFFTFYLEVKQASLADRGEFECRATDWGQTVRKSVFLDVITPPILDLMPINPVVLPGTAVNLTCRDENHLARRTTTKYVWLKNGRPIESSCDEIIEDLTPVGSLLKITAIQHSTNYSCRGENGTKLANKTTHIFVVRPDRACPQEKNRGVEWLMTALDVTNYQFCPAGYVGVTRRRCLSVKQPIDNSEIAATAVREFWKWGEPDFSDCSDREVTELYRQLKLITLGYAVTDIASIINKFADFIQRKLKDFADHESLKSAGSEQTTRFLYLPGEGNALLEIAMNLEAFLWRRTEVLPQSFWDSTAIQYLYALDALLSMPKDFFRLDGGIPILRFIQNHLTLLGISPKGGYPLGAIESHLLKNSDIDTDFNKKELKYKERLKFLPSQTGFKNLTQLAPAQFFLNKPNGSNVTMDFFSTVEQLQIRGGEFICALLLLQPTNHSRGWDYWDMNSCSIERLSDPSAFRCLCSHQGTVVLLYAERDSMQTHATFDLWKIIVFMASTSSLIVVIGVIVLSIKWCRHRCVWAWFQIQLGVALVPPSSAYFLPTESIISDPFWTIVLTVATYQFVTTVWAMIMYLKMNAIHRPDEEEVSDKLNQNNVRLVGLSIGIPLSLSGVQSLIEEFSTGSPFVSWFSQLSSISGIFFCLIYSTLLIAILSLYVMSTRVRDVSSEKFNAFTQEVPNVTEISSGYNQRCLLLAILSLLLTGTMLSHLRWMSLSAHCIAAFLHLLEVLLVFALMMTFSGTNYTCSLLCFWRRNKLPEGETVNELLNATAMVESPQRRNLLSQEQLPVDEDETLKTINKTKRTSQPSVDDTVFPAPKRSKRCNRAGPASSPLLQRAGLGPEVLRAFGVEPQSSHQLVGKTTGCLQAENTSVNGPGDAMGSGRDRVNSIATCDGMQRDDMDSGFGPSGGGGSQKLNGLDRFSDAWKFLSRIRWKLPLRGFPSNGSTSGGGSFRSRQSTMSSATTAEFGGEQSSSVTTEETEVQIRESEDAESLMAPYRLRRSRTRWTDDYGRENELDSREVSNLTIKCKPYRGRCFIRCSPEKIGSNALWNHQCQDVISDRQASWFPTQNDSCERCWHNPETPFCDICLTDNSHPVQNRPGTMFVRAVIENPPQLSNKDDCEYLKMDAAGSLAVDQQRVKRVQVYYNTTVKPATQTTNDGDFNRINKEKLMSCASFTKSSCISPSLLRQKKILSGRIFKKYRISLRNVVHSTQQHRPNEINYPAEFISLRDQTL
ncbi:hypothetical protein DAPPUDRAFT_104018 [Daphnia pulex]|uniref:Ig-like domain-containing protein n=1 Tax=Daphnia pulex TaxID=6669 RepID=E9GL22_DAPPU|nr:hypothetical protein DAPPUDRAFT_104018 [Daphnia pulex]|eukprot:EFX79778.1 hypothetical protein DAPPUDRAFT_104018 [Daphnia pulex]